MKRSKSMFHVLVVTALFFFPTISSAEETYRLRMFFGLSIPTGGAVSLKQWNDFEKSLLATSFDGFNVVDLVGYYQGSPERSKLVTLIVKGKDINKIDDVQEAKKVAKAYARKLGQESVMIVTVPILAWDFIEAEK